MVSVMAMQCVWDVLPKQGSKEALLAVLRVTTRWLPLDLLRSSYNSLLRYVEIFVFHRVINEQLPNTTVFGMQTAF